MEQLQIDYLNYVLRHIYALKKCQDDDFPMREKYNKNNEYFYLEISLLELIPSRQTVIYKNTMFPNLSPQEIYLGYLKGNDIYTKCKDILSYQNVNINLLNMVTPNLDKTTWYSEADLIPNRLVKVFCRMNLIHMKNMLKSCPIPDIGLSPSEYKVQDPDQFVKIINKTPNKKIFDFIPYVRSYSIINNTINKRAVYHLYDEIRLVDSKCFE